MFYAPLHGMKKKKRKGKKDENGKHDKKLAKTILLALLKSEDFTNAMEEFNCRRN